MGLEIERWLWIKDFENKYAISDYGRVVSYCFSKPRILSLCINPSGYQQVSLWIGPPLKKKTFKIHRLVLEAFIGPCPKGMEGCHNDGNYSNNKLDNLHWDTHWNNALDSIVHGTARCGFFRKKQGLGPLSSMEAKEIILIGLQTPLPRRRIADLYFISKGAVDKLLSREHWKKFERD